MRYYDYMRSEKWKRTRERYCRDSECCACGTKSNVQLHHTTYARLGREKYGDLIRLCKQCHDQLHEYLDQHFSGTPTEHKVRLTTRVFKKCFGKPWDNQHFVPLPQPKRFKGKTKAERKAAKKRREMERDRAFHERMCS